MTAEPSPILREAENPERAMAAITLTEVTKTDRARITPLHGVSLEIPAGAFCVVTGPSGSGKSTLLSLIAGREPVTSGTIEIGDVARRSFMAGPLDMAEYVSPDELRGGKNLYANMEHGLRQRLVPKDEVEKRVLAAADEFALGPLLASKARRVPEEARWRTAFGRALAHRPRAILFDDPLKGLETGRRLALRREIKRIQQLCGATAVLATRDPADAMALADIVAVIDGGRIVQAGRAMDLYRAPASPLVARLTGALGINLLPVRANQTGLSLEDGTWLHGASVMTTATFGLLGVRPEHLFPLAAGDDAPAYGARLPLDVEAVERCGAETLLHGRIGPHPVTARIAGDFAGAAPGARTMLGADREHLHMFDAQSQARV